VGQRGRRPARRRLHRAAGAGAASAGRAHDRLLRRRHHRARPRRTVRQARGRSHELAHQWWYALVGNNQYADPWLDESITHYSALRFTGEPGTDCAAPPWQGPDDRITNGHDYWDGLPSGHYFVSVYFIGPCMLADLEQTPGSDRMLAMLKSYAVAHRYGVSTPRDFGAAAQHASPVD